MWVLLCVPDRRPDGPSEKDRTTVYAIVWTTPAARDGFIDLLSGHGFFADTGVRPRRCGPAPMATVTETPELERLFAAGRARARLRANGRERAVEVAMAISFLLVALGMALFVHSPRTLEAEPAFFL